MHFHSGDGYPRKCHILQLLTLNGVRKEDELAENIKNLEPDFSDRGNGNLPWVHIWGVSEPGSSTSQDVLGTSHDWALSHKNIFYIQKYSRCPSENHLWSVIPSLYVLYIQEQTIEIYCEQCKILFYISYTTCCSTFKRRLQERLRKVWSSEQFWSKSNFCLASCKQMFQNAENTLISFQLR